MNLSFYFKNLIIVFVGDFKALKYEQKLLFMGEVTKAII